VKFKQTADPYNIGACDVLLIMIDRVILALMRAQSVGFAVQDLVDDV